MEKLLSSEKVRGILRSCVNLDDLVPQLMKHGLLTPLEFDQLRDRRVNEEQRINCLINALSRKGGIKQVTNFIASLEGAREHTGHNDILSVVKEQVAVLGLNLDTEVVSDVVSSSERKRSQPVQDAYERDSTKKLKVEHKLPNPVKTFTGRQEVLQRTVELLQDDNTQILSIYGPPAVGKSQFVITVGQCIQQLQHNVIYHDLLNATELSDELLDVNGNEHQCLILDNIDNLLHDTQHTSTMLSSLQHVVSRRIKVITTSCKVFRQPQLNVKEIRILPFTEAESEAYLLSMLENHPKQDIRPVIKACAGIPLALRCAVENINNYCDIEEFCDEEDILQLLEVETFGSQDQIKFRFQNKFDLLATKHQKNLKEIVNDPEKLHSLLSTDKRSLYNFGWLESGADKKLFLNALILRFLRDFQITC